MGLDFQGTASQVEKVKLLIAAMICQSLSMIMMMRMIMEMTTMRMIMMRRRRMTSDL